MLPRPPDIRCTMAISSRDSDACVCTSAVLVGRQARRPLRAARASTTRRTAARTPRAGGRSPRRATARESPRSRRSRRASLPAAASGPARRSPSCTCRSSRAGRSRPTASNTASVSCTVSIVSTVVVPLASSSVVARRAAARERGRRVRGLHRPDAPPQPVHQRQIVGVAAEERLAEVDVRLDEPGQDVPAARVDRRDRARAPMCRRDRGDAAVAIDTSPSTMSKRVVHREDECRRGSGAASVTRTASACVPLASTRSAASRLADLAVLHGDQLGEDADGDFLRRDGADVEADRRVDARERARRRRRRRRARRRRARPWRGCR